MLFVSVDDLIEYLGDTYFIEAVSSKEKQILLDVVDVILEFADNFSVEME